MPEPVEVSVSPTPNPHAMKFTLNRTVAVKGETYRLPAATGAAQAGGDPAAVPAPWAKALLSIPGIVGVYGVNNFISANKTPESDWNVILPQIDSALRQAFQ